MVSYGLAHACQVGLHAHCFADSICSCYCHRKGGYAKEEDKVNQVKMNRVYKLELHSLTATRAEFREVKVKAEGPQQIVFNYELATYPADTPTHTWVVGRAEWIDMGRPLNFVLSVAT